MLFKAKAKAKSMISHEGQMRAACIARDAAADMQRAASEMSQAVMDLKMLLADGYGGNGIMLLEELRRNRDNSTEKQDELIKTLEYLKLHRLWVNSHAKAVIESALEKAKQ